MPRSEEHAPATKPRPPALFAVPQPTSRFRRRARNWQSLYHESPTSAANSRVVILRAARPIPVAQVSSSNSTFQRDGFAAHANSVVGRHNTVRSGTAIDRILVPAHQGQNLVPARTSSRRERHSALRPQLRLSVRASGSGAECRPSCRVRRPIRRATRRIQPVIFGSGSDATQNALPSGSLLSGVFRASRPTFQSGRIGRRPLIYSALAVINLRASARCVQNSFCHSSAHPFRLPTSGLPLAGLSCPVAGTQAQAPAGVLPLPAFLCLAVAGR